MPSASHLILPRELHQAIVDAVRQGVENALRDARRPSPACAQLPEFLTIPETMAVLAVSRSALYRIFKSGGLTLVKRGRRSLVSAAQVAAFAERLRAGAERAEGPQT